MIEWLEMCEAMKCKLNRNLNQDELNFLKWVCEEQRQETIKTKQTIN